MADLQLQTYEGQKQATPTRIAASNDVNNVVAQGQQDLASRLDSFAKHIGRAAEVATVSKAKDDAYKDLQDPNATFHRKSTYTAYGQAYNQTASATYAANADMKITEESTRLALENPTNPAGYEKGMSKFVEEMAFEAPTPALSTVIGVSGTKQKNNTFGKISLARDKEIKDKSAATFEQKTLLDAGRMVNLIHTGDVKTADLLMVQMKEYGKTMVRDGVISPAQMIDFENKVQFQVTHGVSISHMEELLKNPDLTEAMTYLQEQTKENRSDMNIQQNDKHQADLKSLINAEVRARKAVATTNNKVANDILKDATVVLEAGKVPNNPDEIQQVFNDASPAQQKNLILAEKVTKIELDFGRLTLGEQEEVLTRYKSNPEGERLDIETIQRLESRLKNRRTLSKTDPITLGAEEGLYEPTEAISVGMNPDSFIMAITKRETQSAINKQQYGQQANKLLTKREVSAFAAFVSSTENSVDSKLQLLSQIEQLDPDTKERLYTEIGTKKATTFSFSGRMLASGNVDAARTAMLGYSADVVLDDEYDKSLKTALEGVYSGFTAEYYNEALDGVTSYSKGLKVQGRDGAGYKDAMKSTIGTVTKYNGKKTLIPVDVSENQFEDWLDDIKIEGRPALTKGLNKMTDFLGSGDYQLHYKAPGEYLIFIQNNGKGYYATDTDDSTKPLVIKYGEN